MLKQLYDWKHLLSGLLFLGLVSCTTVQPDNQLPGLPKPTETAVPTILVPTVIPTELPEVTLQPITSPVSFKLLCGMDPTTFKELDIVKLREWIVNEYEVTPNEKSRIIKDAITLFTWESNGVSRKAYLRDDRLINLKIASNNVYTLRAIVDGLGEPEAVFRDVWIDRDENIRYQIGIDYPSIGIYLFHEGIGVEQTMFSPNGELALHLKDELLIQPSIVCSTPFSSIEEALSADPEIPEDVITNFLQRHTNWPGLGEWLPFMIGEDEFN